MRRTQWRIQEMRGEFQLVTPHLLLFLFWHKSHTTQSLCQFLDYSISFSQCSLFKVSWILMFLRTLFWWLVIVTKHFYLQVAMASWGFNMKHIQALILPVINMLVVLYQFTWCTSDIFYCYFEDLLFSQKRATGYSFVVGIA